jgi:hypothetical protein
MAKKLTEKEIAETYEIVRGFNIPDGDGEKRYEPTKKGRFVTPDDFEPEVWKALVAGGAVTPVEEPLKEDETIAAEVIE